MEKNLERIFWREGKFINMENKEVNPKQIGESVTIVQRRTASKEETIREVKEVLSSTHREYASEINAYTIGIGKNQDNFDKDNHLEYVPITLFKI